MEMSKTEFKVTALRAAGYEAKEIAAKLFRSVETVNTHLKRVRVKNGLRNACHITMEFVLAHGDPRQYIKTLLLAIQISATLMSMDIERRDTVRKPTRTQRTSRREI